MRGNFTPQAAERLTVSCFGIVATVRRRPWWTISQPAQEVRPWASDLADVLNTLCEYLPAPYVQAAGVFGSGLAVLVGLATLVLPRMAMDAEANAARRQATAPPPSGQMPQSETAPPPGHHPAPPKHSGGAAPTPVRVNGLFSENGAAA